MNLKHYILKDGKIKNVPLLVWARWFETSPDRIIGRTIVKKKVRVSTAFLGLDHSFSLNPKVKPILFETMMFSTSPRVEKVLMGRKIKMLPDLKNKALREYQERYHTLEEAEAGHRAAVRFARKMLK